MQKNTEKKILNYKMKLNFIQTCKTERKYKTNLNCMNCYAIGTMSRFYDLHCTLNKTLLDIDGGTLSEKRERSIYIQYE